MAGQGHVGRVKDKMSNHKSSKNPCRSRESKIKPHSALSW